jgi:E3 ubiquitin-protein ligase HUWE1
VLLFHRLPPCPPALTPAMQPLLLAHPPWVTAWIRARPSLLLLPEHYLILNHVLERLAALPDADVPDEIALDEFLKPDLYGALLDAAVGTQRALCAPATRVLAAMAASFPAMDAILGQVAERIAAGGRALAALLPVLHELRPLPGFSEAFPVTVAPALIGALSLDRPADLQSVARLFAGIDEVPPPVVQVLVYLLLCPDAFDPSLTHICAHLPSPAAEFAAPYVKLAFRRALCAFDAERDPTALGVFLEDFPELAREFHAELIAVLDSTVVHYAPQFLHFLGLLLTALGPRDAESLSFEAVATPADPGLTVPRALFEQAPDFWEVIQRHAAFFDLLISESDDVVFDELGFFKEYPQLMRLSARVRLFRAAQPGKLRDGQIALTVSRSNILSDSFGALSDIRGDAILDEIHVQFIGENGVDAGGLTRDWFTTLVNAIFNPNFTLFIAAANGRSSQPNPLARHGAPNFREWFSFAGRIIARAVIEGVSLDAHMTRPMLKHLRSLPMSLKDLESVDQQLYESLHFILENDVTDLGLTFAIVYDQFGVRFVRTFVTDGARTPVTNENKEEYVKKMVQWKLTEEIKEEIERFVGGFHELISPEELRMFTPDELDLLICGVPEIDAEDFRANCHIQRPYSDDHPVIVRFFSVFQNFTMEERARFLLFLTGSSQVPVGGFRMLEDIGRPIQIGLGGSPDRLPQAHTCMNQLDLPEYETEEDMRAKILFAIQECNTFGFA